MTKKELIEKLFEETKGYKLPWTKKEYEERCTTKGLEYAIKTLEKLKKEKNEKGNERMPNSGTKNQGLLEGKNSSGNRNNEGTSDSANELEKRTGNYKENRRDSESIVIRGKLETGGFLYAKGRTTEEAVKDIKTLARFNNINVKSLWIRKELEWKKI